MRLSVIINTYNRGSMLRRTLESLRYQTYPHLEVVVVNGPSTDNTSSILEEYRDLIKIGNCPETNLSMSRNIGIAMAAGDIVAFIDDDAIPEARWAEDLISGYDGEDVGGVGGWVYDPNGVDYQSRYTLCNRLGENRQVSFNPTPVCNMPLVFEYASLLGTNCSFRRDLLLKIGGFDEEYIYYLDETDVCLRLIDSGYKISIVDKAFIHHKYAPSHLRNERRIVTNIYPVVRSRIYFTIKNNEGIASKEQVDEWIRRIIEHYTTESREYLDKGYISEEECDKRLLEITRGANDGQTDGHSKSRQLLTPELLEKQASPFKPFSAILPSDQRLAICFIAQDYPPLMTGGIARFVSQLAGGLARLGHDVFVVTHSLGSAYVEFENGVWVHRVPVFQQPMPKLPNGLRLPRDIWDRSLTFAKEAMRIHKEHHRLDILEAPIYDVEGIAPLLAQKGMIEILPDAPCFEGVLLATSLHTTFKLSLPSHSEWLADSNRMKNVIEPTIVLEKYVLENTDLALANTSAVVDEMEQAYEIKLDPAKVGLVLHGVEDLAPVSVESPREGRVLLNKGINVLFVGRLEERKGIDVLLASIPSLCERFSDVRFIIVGDDKWRRHGQKFVEANRGASWLDRVFFTGKVDEEDLIYYYSNCDIFVAPSRFESFGLIFIEAMRFGKPVIGCRAGGMPEVIEEGVTGLLAEPGDMISLRNALERLISDEALRKTMSGNARKTFESRFTAERMASEALEVYRKGLESR